MTTRKIAIATALLALAALAGCNGSKPTTQPETSENVTDVAQNVVEPSPLPTSANSAAATDTNATAATDIREIPPAPDTQTQDDADAVGMTAHVRRDEAPGNTTER